MNIENQLQYLYYNWVQLRSTRITMVIHPIRGPYNIVYPLATGTASYWGFFCLAWEDRWKVSLFCGPPPKSSNIGNLLKFGIPIQDQFFS